MERRGHPTSSRCKRCRAIISGTAKRCMKCGALLFVAPTFNEEESARLERERLVRKYKLNEIQKQILAAAIGDDQTLDIFVLGCGGKLDGEVKSGVTRFQGNDAVAAVAALAAPGLISPYGADCFRLTADGAKLARTLAARS